MPHTHGGPNAPTDRAGSGPGPAPAPSIGHNRTAGPPHHLHSHISDAKTAEDVQALSAQFIDGFRAAADKAAFLRLAGIPLEIADEAGGAPLKLVDISIRSDYQVGAASPAFGRADLSYLPYPGAMIRERENCILTYVSLTSRRDLDLREWIMGVVSSLNS